MIQMWIIEGYIHGIYGTAQTKGYMTFLYAAAEEGTRTHTQTYTQRKLKKKMKNYMKLTENRDKEEYTGGH